MKLTGVSLFAGVGGFDLAMERAGVEVVASVEIDKHARGILAKHFPSSNLFNDVTEVTGEQLRESGFAPSRGILTGGFPCQDLSIAGKRAGLDGARSGLYWQITRLIDETEPEWVVLENVPGLLTSQRGADMGAVIGALADRGYGVGWRVLDAQNFGVPQRRRRVFIVARRAGDLTSVAKVLFERQGLRGNHPSSRAQGQETTGNVEQGVTVTGTITAAGIRCDLNRAANGHLTVEPVAFDEMNFTTTAMHQTLRAGTPQSTGVVEPDYGDTVFDQSFRMDAVRTYEGVSQSLNARMGTGGNNVPLKVEAETYVKVIRSGARDEDGNLPPEVWRQEETNPTLNQFDQGDSRTVVAIVEPYQKVVGTIAAGAHPGSYNGQDAYNDMFIVEPIAVQGSVVGRSDAAGPGGKGHGEEGDPMFTLNTTDRHAVAYPINTMTLGGRPDPVNDRRMTMGVGDEGDPQFTISATHPHAVAIAEPVAFQLSGDRGNESVSVSPIAYSLQANAQSKVQSVMTTESELPALLTMREGKDGGGKGPLIKYDSSLTLATANNQALFSAGAVRRLTPMECERLQGFPDGWTADQADTHRYKQMGNAVAVPVVEWIINGIVEVMNEQA